MIDLLLKNSAVVMAILLTSFLSAQKMTPEQVVQKQLETYNNLDIDGFMSVIDNEISITDFASGKVTMQGFAACRKFYAALFENSPKLHSTIIDRMVFGNQVIDHERIMGRNGSKDPIELVLIFTVTHEKIVKISVLRKDE